MHTVATIASKVPNLAPGDSLATIIRIMAKSGTQQLPVVSDGELIGILSARDVLQAVARHETNKTADDIMTRNIHSIDASESTDLVAARLVEEAIGCLPVMKGDKLVGILTAADLMAHLARVQEGAKRSRAGKPQPASGRAKSAPPKRRR